MRGKGSITNTHKGVLTSCNLVCDQQQQSNTYTDHFDSVLLLTIFLKKQTLTYYVSYRKALWALLFQHSSDTSGTCCFHYNTSDVCCSCTLNHKLHAPDVEYLIVFIVFITHYYAHIGLMWQMVLAVSIHIYTFLFTPVKFWFSSDR